MSNRKRKRNSSPGSAADVADIKENSSNAVTDGANQTGISSYNNVTNRSGQNFIDLSSGVALVPVPVPTAPSPSASDGRSGNSSSISTAAASPSSVLSCIDFQMLLNTYSTANQISWSVAKQKSSSDVVISKEAGTYSNRKSYNEAYCLEAGNYTFTINDPGGKGLRAPHGNYTVKVAGENVRQGGGYFEPVKKNQSTDFSVAAERPDASSPTVSPGNMSKTPVAVVVDSSPPTTLTYNSNNDSEEQPNAPLFCRFQIILNTDQQGNTQTFWSVESENATVLSKNLGMYNNSASYNETYCLEAGNYTFTIRDKGGNGLRPPDGNYTIKVAGEKVRQGGGNFQTFQAMQSTSFSIMGPPYNSSNAPTSFESSKPSKVTNISSQPSRSPQKSPTSKPSTPPTKAPIRKPSKHPTPKPTTIRPSKSPTTARPTLRPTNYPTRRPTPKPTKEPSPKPSSSPSKIPSTHPSSHPSETPSASPSMRPTKSPKPSSSPSSSPSRAPSPAPSQSPTIAPTPYSSYFETEVLIILSNVNGAMNASTKMIFRAVTQHFLQSYLPTEDKYADFKCNITLLDVFSQRISLSADSNVFIQSYNHSYTIVSGGERALLDTSMENLLVGLRIGGDLHPYNPEGQFVFPEYALYGFDHHYWAYANALSESGQEVFSQMKNSAAARKSGGPTWAVPTAILLIAAAVFFLGSAFCCCFFWKRNINHRRNEKSEVDAATRVPSIIETGAIPTSMFPESLSIVLAQSVTGGGCRSTSRTTGRSSSANSQQPSHTNNHIPDSVAMQPKSPLGKNPFVDSFDEEVDSFDEEDIPLVPKVEDKNPCRESKSEQEKVEEIPLVQRVLSSEESFSTKESDARSTSTSWTEADNDDQSASSAEGEKSPENEENLVAIDEKPPTYSTTSPNRKPVFKSTELADEDDQSVSSAEDNGIVGGGKNKTTREENSAKSSLSSTIDNYPESEGLVVSPNKESPEVKEEFVAFDVKPPVYSTKSLNRRRLFKSRIAIP